MKLLSCHIENFGTLKDCSFDFSNNIHIICEENGWGKSTFAAFIRAMFYGLEGERKKSIEENERKRYKPWQGGVFGGWLIFQVQNKRYKVSRIFYEKESKDQFELRNADTNTLSDDYTRELGKELFKISRDSFMRTIFISQNSCETSASTDINARIGTLADNSDDLNSYEAANAHLTAMINQLTPSRATGSLARRREQIAHLDRIVQDGSTLSDSLETYDKYFQSESDLYESLRCQMKEAGELQTAVTKYQNILAKKEQWEHLKQATASRLRQCSQAKEAFPGEIPSMDEIEEQLSACSSMDRAAERTTLCKLTSQEKEEFSSLQKTFAQGVPGSSEMDEMTRSATQLRGLFQKYADENLSTEELSCLKHLEQAFLNDTEDISSIIARWNLRNTKKSALPSKQATITALKASMVSGSQKKASITVLMVAGILSVVLGIAFFAGSMALSGGIAAGVGGIFLVTGLLSRQRTSSAPDPAIVSQLDALQAAMEEDREFIERTDEEVTAYLWNHGKSFEETSASSTLHLLMEEFVRYSDLKKKYKTARNSATSRQIHEIRSQLYKFLEHFGIHSSENRFETDLYLLKEQASRFTFLSGKETDFKNARISYSAVSGEIRHFLEGYGFSPSENLRAQLDSLRGSLDNYQDSQKLYGEALEELKRFESGMDKEFLEKLSSEDAFPPSTLPSLEDLNQTILSLTEDMENCRHRIGEYNKTLENLQEQYDEWVQNREDLQELKELQKSEERKYHCILKTRDYLSRAKESLISQYAAPILKSFGSYFELITHTSSDHFHIDANADVTVDQQGLQRTVNTLSCGYRDLIGICLRAALVDAMYQDEPPVLIMDDPFTNLDDRKLPAAKVFLTELSKKYQIIYFTCSNSRSFF